MRMRSNKRGESDGSDDNLKHPKLPITTKRTWSDPVQTRRGNVIGLAPASSVLVAGSTRTAADEVAEVTLPAPGGRIRTQTDTWCEEEAIYYFSKFQKVEKGPVEMNYCCFIV